MRIPRSGLERRDVLDSLKAHPEEAGIFLDLDGTLAELVDVPEAVRMPAATRGYLETLGTRYRSVAIISGRSATSIEKIVDLPDLTYVGNHGLELVEGGERRILLPPSEASRMRKMAGLLRQSVDFEGAVLELKELSHAVHYRRASDPARAREHILATLEGLRLEGVRILEGKFLVQIRPDVPLDKGTAVELLVRERGLRKVLYAGDDTTDLDAFRAVGRLIREGVIEGHRIAVWHPDAPPDLIAQSDLQAAGVEDVGHLLGWLAGSKRVRQAGS
ncbi:MAG: trehalose-phosphatase [Thermoplasmata archaeon]